MNILMMLILPIHELDKFFYLFVFSSVFFRGVLFQGLYVLLHADIVTTKFLTVMSSLTTLTTIALNSVSDNLLASVSVSSFSGDSSFFFHLGVISLTSF